MHAKHRSDLTLLRHLFCLNHPGNLTASHVVLESCMESCMEHMDLCSTHVILSIRSSAHSLIAIVQLVGQTIQNCESCSLIGC